MNNQIVEISCEELDLVSGGCPEWLGNFGSGLVKPFGFYGKTKDKTVGQWSYKDLGECSLSGNGKMGAVGTAITDTAIVSGLMAAGATVMYFVKDKVDSLLGK
ncbi:MAG: hypothetical protein Q4B84_00245 [Clostridia bacterium]|nr:hypothetical protein [Clostridia bacterium]